MKKFLSLVLALVMALSFTTVAWGAATEVATADDLLAATTRGDAEVKLTADITLPAGQHVPVVADLVVDGNGHSITFTPGTGLFNNLNGVAGPGPEGITNDLTVKNLTMISTTGGGYAVVAKNGAADFAISFTNCHFEDMYCGAMLNGNVDPDPAATNAPMATISGSTFEDTEYGVSFVTEDCVDEVSFENNTMTGETSIQETFAAGSGYLTAPTVEISSGSFSSDVSEYVADGSALVQDTNGNWVAGAAVTMGDKYDLYLADKNMNTMLKLKTPNVADLSFDEKSAKTNKDGSGNVAYIAANNGEYYVKTATPTITSYAVTEAGKTSVLYYVNVTEATSAEYFGYSMAVTAFTNFGMKCGQVDNVNNTIDTAEDYFLYPVDGKVYLAGDATADADYNFLLNGAVVSGATGYAVIDHTFVANDFKYDATLKTNVPTKAICTTCLTTSTAIYDKDEVPATMKPYTMANAADYRVVVAGTPAVPTTPSTDKVTSAETFDAGIAMYVGMSVMAAAGSAVVIGKKKEF